MVASVLPNNLIVKILSWILVKSLMHFRCIAKAWNSLILNPIFVKLHLQRSPKNTQLLLTCQENILDNESAATLCSSRRLLENSSSIFDDCNHFDHNYYFLDSCNELVYSMVLLTIGNLLKTCSSFGTQPQGSCQGIHHRCVSILVVINLNKHFLGMALVPTT